jgi:predicted nucleic-acid-binding protein
MIGVDTNVLVHLLAKDEPTRSSKTRRHAPARRDAPPAGKKGDPTYLSLVVIVENRVSVVVGLCLFGVLVIRALARRRKG